jgi:hypothetical protein
VLTVLGEHDQHDAAGRFHSEFGKRFHDGAAEPGEDPVEAAVLAAAVHDALETASAAAVDDAKVRHLADALAAPGPDSARPTSGCGRLGPAVQHDRDPAQVQCRDDHWIGAPVLACEPRCLQ